MLFTLICIWIDIGVQIKMLRVNMFYDGLYCNHFKLKFCLSLF